MTHQKNGIRLRIQYIIICFNTKKEGNYRTKVALAFLLERAESVNKVLYRLYQRRCLVGKVTDLQNYTISDSREPMQRFET